MKKRHKLKNKNLVIGLIVFITLVVIASTIGSLTWAYNNLSPNRQVPMSKEMDRINFPGKSLSRSYTNTGCITGQTFGFGVRTCNTYIQDAFASNGNFCSDFNAFDSTLKKAGYKYMNNNDPSSSGLLTNEDMVSKYGSNVTECDYFQELVLKGYSKSLVYAFNTTDSTTNNFSVYCEIGTDANPYALDSELDLPKQNIESRSKVYGCILHHN